MPRILLVAITLTLLALLQFFYFGFLVGKARATYSIKAPAVSGNDIFERYFRVQMNTLEQLVQLLPLLWIACEFKFIADYWIALLGALYLIGRFLYQRSYVADPAKRSAGFGLSALPVLILYVIDAVGLIRACIASNAV
jgi:glutathione S-transferase